MGWDYSLATKEFPMSAKIIPFKPGTIAGEDTTEPAMTSEAARAAIQRLDEIDRELQIQAYAINLSIGEVRRQRSALLRLAEASRSA